MKNVKEGTKPERNHIDIQKDLRAAGISLLVLIGIMVLYFLFG